MIASVPDHCLHVTFFYQFLTFKCIGDKIEIVIK